VYQFHDTTIEARMRNTCKVADDRYLMSDAGNLAAVLRRLAAQHPILYARIVSIIQQVAPFFEGFVLDPDPDSADFLLLRWREKGALDVMMPNQLSDGTIRFIALTTLLNLQPVELPGLIIIDEPELGLHPAAINLLAEMLRVVSENGRTQVFISTQSVRLVDRMKPEEVIVADRAAGGGSTFHRPKLEDLKAWLEDFNMGEIWEMNVYGGRP
jgi:predicted ATPase